MFRRKKVQPSVDEYILRRYDDIAVRIYADLHSERGLQNLYAPWLEGMLQGFPAAQRNKYSLMTANSRPVLSAWAEEPGGSSTHAPETSVTDEEKDLKKKSHGLQVEKGSSTRARENVGEGKGEWGSDANRNVSLQHLSGGRVSNTSSKLCIIL